MSVFEAVERDISALGVKAEGTALAATALALAVELDGRSSATSKSMCAKALIDVLRELRSIAPPREEKDDLSKLREQRQKRRAGLPAAENQARP